MNSKTLIVPDGKGGFKNPPRRVGTQPVVTGEVEEWGALVQWLRRKSYKPAQIREMVAHVEKEAMEKEAMEKEAMEKEAQDAEK